MLTDSRSPFDILSKSSTTREKLQTIEFQTVSDAYQSLHKNDVPFIISEHNIADANTEASCNSAFQNTLNAKKIFYCVHQCIIRERNRDAKSTNYESENVSI